MARCRIEGGRHPVVSASLASQYRGWGTDLWPGGSLVLALVLGIFFVLLLGSVLVRVVNLWPDVVAKLIV